MTGRRIQREWPSTPPGLFAVMRPAACLLAFRAMPRETQAGTRPTPMPYLSPSEEGEITIQVRACLVERSGYSQGVPKMKISRIRAYRVELPLHEGSYKWSGGKSVTVFDSTVVEVQTDAGVTGYGEVCPLGPFYLPAYAAGVRAGLVELGPHLLGEDPRELQKL